METQVSLDSVLRFKQRIVIPANKTDFIPGEHFVINIDDDNKPKIGYIGVHVDFWFLRDGGKIEGPCVEKVVDRHLLTDQIKDESLFHYFMENSYQETTLYQIFYLLKSGNLDTSKVHVFYPSDTEGKPWAFVLCDDNGFWDIDAVPLFRRYARSADEYIYSCSGFS